MVAATLPTLEERVARLEASTEQLLSAARRPAPNDWRAVVGMFGDSDLMKQVDEEGQRWRAEENRRTLE